tara:strand:- start:274 stop:435 length:162 start_codon:yes stop_codon:yes gene_type:complete
VPEGFLADRSVRSPSLMIDSQSEDHFEAVLAAARAGDNAALDRLLTRLEVRVR